MVGPYLSNVYSINGMLLISRKRLNFCSLIQVFLCVFSSGPSSVMLFQGLKDLIRENEVLAALETYLSERS